MSRRRWTIWLGPPIALIAIALALSRFQAGAEAGGRATVVPVNVCSTSPSAQRPIGRPEIAGAMGTWWALTGRLDANGALAGRHLALGRGGAANLALELASDAMASGPSGGIVAVTTDDGRHSQVRLVAVEGACSFTVAETAEVARGAIFDSADGSVVAHLVDRESREDLGTWRYAGDGTGEPALVAPALEHDPARGPNWITDLHLDPDSNRLAVQSCTDEGCLTRIFDLGKGLVAVARLEGDQGQLIGLTRDGALTWAQCVGLPCAINSWSFETGAATRVVERAESAAVSANGRFLVAVTDSTRNGFVRIELATGDVKGIRGVNRNERLVGGGVTSSFGIEVRADEVGLAADGAIPRPFNPAGAEVLP